LGSLDDMRTAPAASSASTAPNTMTLDVSLLSIPSRPPQLTQRRAGSMANQPGTVTEVTGIRLRIELACILPR
jgi:hypothetical protein